jgi:hypothetical protein
MVMTMKHGVIGILVILLQSAVQFARADPVSVTPVTTWRVSVTDDGRKRLSEYAEEFADAHGYSVQKRQVRPDSRFVIIQLLGENSNILILNPIDPNSFRISYYLKDKRQEMDKNMSEEIAIFDSGISELEGVVLEKKR